MMIWSRATQEAGAISVNVPSKCALLEDIDAAVENGSGFQVATLNLDHVVKLRSQPEFHAAYARHSHVTADGNPIVWLSRLAGQKVELVPGSELIEPIAEIAARHGVPIALLGATEDTLSKTAQRLTARYPGLKIAAQIAPPMGFDPEGTLAQEYMEQLFRSGAGVCFLALGAPKQEIFASHAKTLLPDIGFVSIGAGLDFIAGSQRRAPRIVRMVAAEWLWRMLANPGRLAGRYAACLVILPSLFTHALNHRLSSHKFVR
jgi:exopolysaccharide biosynthesis WecB/TagA/CpsF family protein